MRYEVKIGILALVAIGMAFWGFKYIQGTNLFSNSNAYYANYDNVTGLTVGTPVQISGVIVGSVSDIQLDQQTRLVQVQMDVRDEINVPKSTVAYIVSASILGEKAIDLNYTNPCFGEGDCAEDGAVLEGSTKSMLEEFLGVNEGENPLGDFKGQLGDVVDSLRYTLFDPESDNPIARSSNDLATTMESLKASSRTLQRILNSNAGEIDRTMKNIAGVSETLAAKQESLGTIIDNASGVTTKLNQLELEETVEGINTAVGDLKTTVGKANNAIEGVTVILNDVRDGRGTLGKLLTDDELGNRLEQTIQEADTLFSDIQERPYRYVPFKSRRRVLRQDRKDGQLENVGPKQ